ncbi:MAG: carbohydrate kinase family protein [Planctomycetia bacterium]|nr:carbohydrate kinase family protein [Planctomycetia bacterium]
MNISSKKHRCLSAGILFADVGCAPINHCPVPGELVQTDRVELSLGGCASNVALNLAKLDVPVGLCGCVGDDALSDFVIHALEHPLIDTEGIRRIPNSGPGCSLIVNVQGQDRRFVSTTGANAEFKVADISKTWADEAEVFYIGGYLMMPHLEEAETISFLQKFQAHGGKTILDVVIYGNRPYWNVIRPLLPFVDYFMPNNDEGRLISGFENPIDQAKFFLDAGVRTVIITCGEAGSIYYSAKQKFQTNVFSVEFIGGTGSGDAFAAGFISALLDQADPIELMNRASAQGMSCVRDSSATKSVFTRKEAEDFVKKNQLLITEIG